MTKDQAPAGPPKAWFGLTNASEADLSEPHRRLLHAARVRLESLRPAKAWPEESWASLEPNFPWQRNSTGEATLWLCAPIADKGHDSLQVGLGGTVIVGGWQDRHYAWDTPREEAFRAPVEAGAEDGAINEALDWLERELRRHSLI